MKKGLKMRCHLSLLQPVQWGKLVVTGPILCQIRHSMYLRGRLLDFRIVRPTMVVVHGAVCVSVGRHWFAWMAMAADELCGRRHWIGPLGHLGHLYCPCSCGWGLAEVA